MFIFLLLLSSLLMITPVAAQDATPTPTLIPSTEGALTIWADAARLAALEALGQQFTAQYGIPVRIQTMGFGDVRNNLQLSAPVGQGPDIILGAHDWIGQLYTNGVIAPIELPPELIEQFDPVSIRAFTYDGVLVGVPYLTEAIGLYYNTDMIAEPPATWAELVETAQQVVADGTAERGLAIPNGSGDPYHHFPIFTGFGSYIFGLDENGGYNAEDLGLDNEGGVAAMREIDRLVKADVLNAAVGYGEAESLFHNGQLAMWITGPWALANMRASGVPYAVAAIPTMETTPRPFVGAQGFMINAFSNNRLLAEAFLRDFVATQDGMQLLFDQAPFIPAFLALRDSIEDQDLINFSASVAAGDPMPAIPAMNAVWTAWGNAIQIIYQQQGDPEATIAEAAAAIRAEIARSGS